MARTTMRRKLSLRRISFNLADGKKPAYSKGKNFSNNNSYSDKYCTFCGRNGHTIEICYRKNGYPPDFKFRDGSTPPKTAMANYIASTSQPPSQLKQKLPIRLV
jgi:hypothetical protein